MSLLKSLDKHSRDDEALPTELRVRDLRVSAKRSSRPILDGLELNVAPGSVTGVVGESGSGKTTLLRCLLGATNDGLDASGTVELVDDLGPVSLLDASRRHLRAIRAIRAQRVAYLAQDPARSLTPTMRISDAIAERLPHSLGHSTRAAAVRELLASVGLPDDDEFMRRHPFALSGGQAQRVALARALAASPDLLLLDEPTTGLDVATQAELLDELRRQHERTPRTTVIVSHDLTVIARLADHLIVLRHGSVVETGPCQTVLRQPSHPYTRELVDACPDPHRHTKAPVDEHATSAGRNARLQVEGLVVTHRRRRHPPVVAANQLDLKLRAGTCVALVGASGSGKSTIARSIAGAHVPDAGTITADGRLLSGALGERAVADLWRMQLVPQDPTTSLDPRRRVGRSVGDVVRRCHASGGSISSADIEDTVARLFLQVDLDPALAAQRPGALSGGECQRVAIARALAASPDVLICDEVTSALDVSVQAGVIRLLRSLVTDHGLTMLFITHDLGLIHDIADDVAVLHDGGICEFGRVGAVVNSPRHPATRTLLAASPSLSSELARTRTVVQADS